MGNRPAAGEAEAFRELARHIARGSHAVFLSPEVFKKDDKTATLAAAGQQGQLGIAWTLALSQGRLGQEPSDLRRPARRLHPGPHVLSRSDPEHRLVAGRMFRPKWWPARSTRPCGYIPA